jgi:predicted outer membrane repeat protein
LSGGQVLSNTATNDGGGIHTIGSLSLVNTTVSGNTASNRGGGIYSLAKSSVLTYTTVTSNTATSGGSGIHRADGTVFLKNTIVAYNGTANCGPALTSNGHNLDSDDTCNLTSTTDLTSTNPLLGQLGFDRGTWVHPLLDGSPAINAGDCAPAVTTVDQRGVTRPQVGKCDIGAYEWIGRKVYLPLLLRNH